MSRTAAKCCGVVCLLVAGVPDLLAQKPPYDVFPPAEPPYYRVRYEASDKKGELPYAVNYTVWIPPGVTTLRGVVVHQHGCGEGSCKSGLTGAYDLHWQALARKHDCALLSPSYEQPEKADCQMWCDPRNGSDAAFRKCLADLGAKSGHPELAKVPWALWGHSGGGHWAGGMVMLHPDRVAAAWLRSGVPLLKADPKRPGIKAHTLPDAALKVPLMCNLGTKEGVTVKDDRFSGVWPANEAFFTEVRGKGGLVGVAVDPLSSHECGNQRYLAIPWLDACLSARLPKAAGDPLVAMPTDKAWLAPPTGSEAVPAAKYAGEPLEAAWLPNEVIAKAWMEYVKDTKVSDTTSPPAPTNVRVRGDTLTWEAEADPESGLARFVVERDGQSLADVPEQGKNPFGRPVFQGLQYSDTPTQPLVPMQFTDAKAEPGKKHTYRVIAVNTVGLTSKPSAEATAAERPNVLLIMADDLGFSDVGCYGGEISTPNLDALAKNGLRFRQFYNCTRCCPTRASLLTGLYPHQAGVGDMTGDAGFPGYRGFPQPNTATIAEVLRSAGYHTSMVGKWHLGGPKRPSPTDRGFDEFYGMIGGFNSCFQEDPFYTRLPADRTKREYAKDAFYSTDAFGDYALDFLALARKEKKPFFQYLAFNAPHFPLHAKPEDIKKYADTYTKGWDKVREERHKKQIELGLLPKGTPLSPRSPFTTRRDFLWSGENPAWESLDADRRADLARRMAVYAAMVDRMDRTIGRVIDDLRKHGELDNTLVLFLSDNGACAEWDPFGFDENSGPKNILHKGEQLAAMGGPGTYHSYGSGWANAGCTPFRLYKHYCHEGGIRTPLIAHWPKGIAAKGEFRDQAGHVIDVMATCVDLCGATYPAKRGETAVTPAEGKSLAPAFAGKPLDREYLAWEHEGNRAIRAGKWKLVAKAGAAWELYDMDADPVELTDLAAKHPDRVKELAATWDAWAKRCDVLPYPLPKKK